MYDVLVIGGGPVGSWVAFHLASRGRKVAVLEEHGRIGEPVHCSGVVGRECLERFPVGDGVALRGVSSATLFAPSGLSLRVWKDRAQAYVLDRAAFDRTLATKAQEKGADYLLGARVEGVALLGDRVRVEVERLGGGGVLEAKAVAIAAGGDLLPQQLGLGAIGDLAVGAQAQVEAPGVEEVEVYFGKGVAPGFYAWLVPLSSDRALVGLLSRKSPGLYLRGFLDSLFRQGKISSPEAEIAYGAIPLRPLPKTYGERVVVVGSAAGQNKPTTGGGIFYGLLCAEIAAETLEEALLRGDLSEGFLRRYERRWKRKLSRELRVGYFARRLYEGLEDSQINEIFALAREQGLYQDFLHWPELTFDWHGGLILKALRQEAVRRVLSRFLSRKLKALLFGASRAL